MPDQGAAGRGGCQRSAPTGGAAYGMPRNSSPAATAWPRTAPPTVVTTGALAALAPALLLAPGVAVALVHAAAAISTAVAAAPAASPVRTRCPIGIARISALTWWGRNSLTVLNN